MSDWDGNELRMRQMCRQWMILRELSGVEGKRITDMATTTGVTRRTTYRDVHCLQMAGFPIESFNRNGDSRWRLTPGFRLKQYFGQIGH